MAKASSKLVPSISVFTVALSQKALNSLEEKGGSLSAQISLATPKVKNQFFSWAVTSSTVILFIF